MNASPGFVSSIAGISDVRATDPGRIAALLAARRRRPLLRDDGRLLVIACDHPARAALDVRDRVGAMNSRSDLLDRLVTALARPGVDGVLATADLAEDLLLLGALEDKVVLGSMNRGGLTGSVFEMDDRMTAYDVPGVVRSGFEGAKMLTRIGPDDPATVATLETCARAVTDLDRAGLVALLEPFWSRRVDGAVTNDLSPDAVIRSIHVAQALGASSAHTWLKLPVVAEMERVMDATTLPTLVLGGDPVGSADDRYANWEAALSLPPVRGLVAGRALLYPDDDDVAAAVDITVSLVRPGARS